MSVYIDPSMISDALPVRKEFALPTPGVPRRGSSLAQRRRGYRDNWTVAPPFAQPGQALSELGVEAFESACKEYYAKVAEMGIDGARRTYARWVVRRCVSNFETLLRQFRRHWKERTYRYQGHTIHETNPAKEAGQYISPLEFYKSARFMVDLQSVFKRWQVAEEWRGPMERLLRQKLAKLWELEVDIYD